jgi:hypothetical protein
MEIKLNTRDLVADLTVTSGNATISEDVAEINSGFGHIPVNLIEEFMSIANQMHNYNRNGSDVEFVKMVHDAFLSDSEKQRFYELLEAEQEVSND